MSKILIVEDEQIEAMNFKQFLESSGYDIVGISSTGEDAIGKVAILRPDLVLMDIVLKGDMDGIEVAAKIKEDFDIPVIYLTAHPEESTVKRAKLTTPYGYLIKPVNKTDLNNTIELALYKHQMESKLIESEKKYRNLYSSMNEGVAVHKVIYDDNQVPVDYEILDVNPAYVEILRMDRKDFSGKKASDAYGTRKAPYLEIYSEVAKTGTPTQFETYFKPMNKYFNISVFSPAHGFFATVFEDITGRKISEKRFKRLYRIYATLSQINQSIVRIKEREKLFETICKVCIESGNFKMAWIGLIDNKTGNIRPVTYYGDEDGYLEKISININNKPSINKPTTLAIHTGEIILIEDIKKELYRKWRDEALKRGYRSFAVIPLRLKGEVIGNLNIYASEANFFNKEEIQLIEEIGADISYAINFIESEKKLNRVNEALKQSEKKYRELVNYSIVAVYETNLNGEILFANDAMAKMFEYTSVDELKTKNITKLYKKSTDREKIIQKIKETKVLSQYEVVGVTKSGKTLNLLVNAHLTDDTISGMIMDITKREKAENKVKMNAERFRAVAESAVDAIVTTDMNGKILFCNQSMVNIFRYTYNELINKNLTVLMPAKFKNDYIKGLEKFRISGEHNHVGKTLRAKGLRKDGTEFPFEMSLASWKFQEKTYFTAIIRDVTEREKAEKQIKNSLREKEVLLKEIHHRVKNNLQIISSLLELQEDYVKENPTAVNSLKESENRVFSMAMIHEMIYQSKDLSQISFPDYINNLINNLFHSYGVKSNINTKLDVEEIHFNIETSVPLGLIINEIVSNSLKYAFTEAEEGEISIQLHQGNGGYELIISDNGIGIPEEIDFKDNKSTLGLRLVNILVQQLNGSIELDRKDGTKYTTKFQELKYNKRI